jgi:hypothetical protein
LLTVEEEIWLTGRGFGHEVGPFIDSQTGWSEHGFIGEPRVVPCGNRRGGQRASGVTSEESAEWVSRSACAGGSICRGKACRNASCPPGFAWHAVHSTNGDDGVAAEAGPSEEWVRQLQKTGLSGRVGAAIGHRGVARRSGFTLCGAGGRRRGLGAKRLQPLMGGAWSSVRGRGHRWVGLLRARSG